MPFIDCVYVSFMFEFTCTHTGTEETYLEQTILKVLVLATCISVY